MTNSYYEKIINEIVATGIATPQGLAYFLDFSTKLHAWHNGHADFYSIWNSIWGNRYFYLCQDLSRAGDTEIMGGQRAICTYFSIAHTNLALPPERRVLASWALYISQQPESPSLELVAGKIGLWLKDLEGSSVNIGTVLSNYLSAPKTSLMPETKYRAYVLMPLLLGAGTQISSLQRYLAPLIKTGPINVTERILVYARWMLTQPKLGAVAALNFLTGPIQPGYDESSIALLIAGHHDLTMNRYLQGIFSKILSAHVPIQEFVPKLLHAQDEQTHYGYQLAMQERIAESACLLHWFLQYSRETERAMASSLLPSGYLVKLISLNDNAVFSELLTILMELLTDPGLANTEFLRLEKVFLTLHQTIIDDSFQDATLQGLVKQELKRLRIFSTLHHFEKRRNLIDEHFAVQLHEVCLTLLTNQNDDNKIVFKKYLIERIERARLDLPARTVCHIYLQCIYLRDVTEAKRVLDSLEANHSLYEEYAEANRAYSDLSQKLPHNIQKTIKERLIDNHAQLLRYGALLSGDVSLVDEPVEIQALHGFMQNSIGTKEDRDEFVSIVQVWVRFISATNSASLPRSNRKNMAAKVNALERHCKNAEETLRDLFASIQNNYATYPDFLLSLLNMKDCKQIWYPALVALASVDKQLFQSLFDRALSNCLAIPDAAANMLISSQALLKNKVIDQFYYKNLFIDVHGNPQPFSFVAATQQQAEVNRCFLSCIASLGTDYLPLPYFSAWRIFTANLLELLFQNCSDAGCDVLLGIVQTFFNSPLLSPSQAVSLYNLCESVKGQLPYLKSRYKLSGFLLNHALIRLHYYIEARSLEGLDIQFEQQLQVLFFFIQNKKLDDITAFQTGQSHKFNSFIQILVKIPLEPSPAQCQLILNSLENYRHFLISRITEEIAPNPTEDLRIRIINRRLLIPLLKDQPTQIARMQKMQSELEDLCKKYADKLHSKLSHDYVNSYQGLLWMADFSNYVKHVIADLVSSNQPFRQPTIGRFFYPYPTELQQQRMTTKCRWQDYEDAKAAKQPNARKEAQHALCVWLDQHCTKLRLRSSIADRDVIMDVLKNLVDTEAGPRGKPVVGPLLQNHPALAVAIIPIIINLMPEKNTLFEALLAEICEECKDKLPRALHIAR